MNKITLISTVLAATLFIGCNNVQSINQSKICIFSTDEEAKSCKNGEISFFAPERWGNERLPLNVIAAYCNTNHQIIMNNSGVICTFTNERIDNVK